MDQLAPSTEEFLGLVAALNAATAAASDFRDVLDVRPEEIRPEDLVVPAVQFRGRPVAITADHLAFPDIAAFLEHAREQARPLFLDGLVTLVDALAPFLPFVVAYREGRAEQALADALDGPAAAPPCEARADAPEDLQPLRPHGRGRRAPLPALRQPRVPLDRRPRELDPWSPLRSSRPRRPCPGSTRRGCGRGVTWSPARSPSPTTA
jgi:hypothetical protein